MKADNRLEGVFQERVCDDYGT